MRRADAIAWQIQERGHPSPREYLQLVRRWNRRVASITLALLADAERMERRGDADDDGRGFAAGVWARFQQMLGAITARGIFGSVSRRDLEQTGRRTARQAARAERAALVRAGKDPAQLSLDLGLGPGDNLNGPDITLAQSELDAMTGWAQEGVDLIRTRPEHMTRGIARKVAEAVGRDSLRVETLRGIIETELGVTKRHAELIARDQVAKLNGRITQATHQRAGVTHYRWRASRDGRTRSNHRKLDGQTFAWSEAPMGGGTSPKDRGHPGQGIQCRCNAIPIIDERPEEEPAFARRRRQERERMVGR